jgi:hypothetical protein
VIGAAGENYGLLVFRSFSDYVAFTRHGLAGDRTRLPSVPLFSINYDAPGDAPRDLARRARADGWEIAGKRAFPHILKVDPDRLRSPVGVEDFRFASACLLALTRLLRKRRHLFARPLRKAVDETFSLYDLPGRASVRLVAPHPEATWRWGDETAAEVIQEAAAQELGAVFGARLREEGRSDELMEGATFVVEQLLDFKVRYVGGSPEDWTPDEIEAFLLDHFPRKGNPGDGQIETIPDHLVAFFQWLVDSGRGDARRHARIIERIRRRREAFVREVQNPARFGPAKTVVMAMQREGIDIGDQKAVDGFVKRFNARIARDPSTLPLPFDLPGQDPVASARTKAWVWRPGTPAPQPTDPCPCGNGRRYKKCCLPR